MPALKPTDYFGTITFLGAMPKLSGRTITAGSLTEMEVDFGGAPADAHYGLTRPSCSRVVAQHPKGTQIRNSRQLSLVSVEELAQIAATLGIAAIDPLWLGATIVVEGIPDFTHVPPSSRLQGPDGVTLVVDMANRPCHIVAQTMTAAGEAAGERFKVAAKGRRGVTASVERPGRLQIGDRLRLHVPDQRLWAP